MKYQQQVLDEPGGNPVPFLGIRVKRKSDGVTLTSLVTDANGFVTYEASGHAPPFFFETTNTVGGPRFWLSDETMPAGSFSPAELPHLLRALGDGVLPNDGGFGLTIVGTTLTLGSGVSLAAGYPVVIYDDVTINATRPSSGTRIDRIVARVYPAGASTDPGYADVALVAGTVDSGSAPALVQTANEWQVALWRVVVPAAGALTAIDDRVAMLAGYLSRPATVSGQARSSSVSTSSAGGEALSGLTVSLVLPTSRTYDIAAKLSANQHVTAGSAPVEGLVFASAFGSYGSGLSQFNDPQQVAVAPDDTLWVADRGNSGIKHFSAVGAFLNSTGATTINGVASDSNGTPYGVFKGIFVYQYTCGFTGGGRICNGYTYYQRVRKFSPTFGVEWDNNFTNSNPYGHAATDGTHVYVTHPSTRKVYKLLTADGSTVASWGTTGSGNGQFQQPIGIATDGSSVWVGDASLNRVQRFSTDGVYQDQFGTAGSADGQFGAPEGVAWDALNSLVVVADTGNHRIQRFSAGVFVDSAGTLGSGDGQLNAPTGVAVDSAGDVLVSDSGNHRIVRFTGISSGGSPPGGYGTVAVDIDSDLSAYLGPGQITCGVGNVHTRAVAGPATVLVKAYGKATTDAMSLRSACLSATAIPRG